MIVIDASALVDALTGLADVGAAARQRLDDDPDLHAPHLLDVEFVSSIRNLRAGKLIDETHAIEVLGDFYDLRVARYPHRALLRRVWELRANLTPYDATYVALAEALDVVLVTSDARLARAPGLRCQVEVLA